MVKAPGTWKPRPFHDFEEAVFTVTSQTHRKLLRVKLSGFFTRAEVIAFAAAAQAAVAEMGCESGDWYHLCDASDLKLQSQEVVDAITGFINNPARRSRKLAIVTGKASIRMQIRRVLDRPDAAMFETIEEAERWLFDGMGEPCAASARAQAALLGN